MPTPLTADEFRQFTSTFEETLKRNLNDRFDHYEKRAVTREDQQHREIMTGFGEIISTVNDHMDERFDRLEKLMSLDHDVRVLNDRFAELAKRTGNPDLATPIVRPAT